MGGGADGGVDGSMKGEVKDAARAAESSTVMRVLARSGFVANGIVHLIIGVIVLVIAVGGDGDADQTGALKALAAAPLGFAVLWALAVGLWALAAWRVLEGILARSSGTVQRWRVRISQWGQAVVFAVLGVLAASVALGARPDAEQSAEHASRGVLSIPGGPFVLGAVGIAIGIAGVAFVVMGVRCSFEQKMRIPVGAWGGVIRALGVTGFLAKGVALAIVAVLLVVAAVRVDPEAAGGLDGAITALLALAYGPWLVGLVGGGLVAYGLFCLARARYDRL
ncbi:MAG TPA: DUF1206 domain-containing protein [Microbacterium sp.]|nr:DUF1206 domain-containing protein [Microbacterium sp.]